MTPETVRAKRPTGRSKVAYHLVENSATHPVFMRCVTVRLDVSAFDPFLLGFNKPARVQKVRLTQTRSD